MVRPRPSLDSILRRSTGKTRLQEPGRRTELRLNDTPPHLVPHAFGDPADIRPPAVVLLLSATIFSTLIAIIAFEPWIVGLTLAVSAAIGWVRWLDGDAEE